MQRLVAHGFITAQLRLHVHEREDETWFVLEGEYTFEVGGQTFRAGPGDYVFGPRNVPHSYANRTEAVAQLLGTAAFTALLGLGVARYSDAGDEITLTGEIGWPPQIKRDKIADTAREHACQDPAGCHHLLPTRGM
jgi:uncharacterized cupin superfamily protein